MFRARQVLLTLAVTMGMVAAASAAPFSFSGNIPIDTQLTPIQFTQTGTSAVTIQTFGYAGGTDANGRVVPRGGFDPVFGLFSSTGALLDIGDDGSPNIDPVTGTALDALLTITLGPGTYTIVLAQFDNFPLGPNLSNGFYEQGKGNFTGAFGCSAGRLCDFTGANRTGSWDISISGTGVTTGRVPEPASMALLGLGLLGLGAARRRKMGISRA